MKPNKLKKVFIFALVEYTAVVDHISGAIRGSVFAKNKGGNYIRGRGTVDNPQTTAQTIARSIFGAISSAWNSLSANQRYSWNRQANQFPYQNRLGNRQILSGKALFQKLNTNLMQVGADPIDSPPVKEGVTGFSEIGGALNIDTGQESLDFQINLNGDAGKTAYILEATPGLSPGISNAKNQFRQLAVTGSAGLQSETTVDETDFFTDDTEAYTKYIEKLGTIEANQKVFIRLRPVHVGTGESGSTIQEETIVSNL